MICPYCKEQVDVGEAKEEAEIGNRTRYFHVGHFRLYQEAVLAHYEKEDARTRTIH